MDEKTHEREWTCCGVVTVETEAHTFGKWVTTVKPTAHKKGEKKRTCEVCGYTQTKTVSPTGGSGTTDSGKKPATGTDDRLPFDDVRRGDWFYDDVRYVYETGLMNGTANRIFAPNVSTTRAMIVTILWAARGLAGCEFCDALPRCCGKMRGTVRLFAGRRQTAL